ncbi:uncharacterized protein PHA67_009130 isoform 1-T1 [Liasis olivaceus]
MTADNESTRHMAISDTAPLLAAMPVSFHQRAEQLYYPSLLRCGNQGRQRHSQILAKQHGLQFISKLSDFWLLISLKTLSMELYTETLLASPRVLTQT